MILGLTGAYCAGKNLAARILTEHGWHCIDVDKLGHEALALCIAEVAALLGPEVLDPDGNPNRKAIGAAVFEDSALLARYEGIVHPEMFNLCELAVNAALAQKKNVCINAMILYRMPQAEHCDMILEIGAPLCQRILRGKKRDRLSVKNILDRMVRQRSILALGTLFTEKRKRIMNSGSPAALEKKVLGFLESID